MQQHGHPCGAKARTAIPNCSKNFMEQYLGTASPKNRNQDRLLRYEDCRDVDDAIALAKTIEAWRHAASIYQDIATKVELERNITENQF